MERDYEAYCEAVERLGDTPLSEEEWLASMRPPEPSDAEIALYRNRLAFVLGPGVIAEWDKEDI